MLFIRSHACWAARSCDITPRTLFPQCQCLDSPPCSASIIKSISLSIGSMSSEKSNFIDSAYRYSATEKIIIHINPKSVAKMRFICFSLPFLPPAPNCLRILGLAPEPLPLTLDRLYLLAVRLLLFLRDTPALRLA